MKRKSQKTPRMRPAGPSAAVTRAGGPSTAPRRWRRWLVGVGLIGLVAAAVFLSTRPEPPPVVSTNAPRETNFPAANARPVLAEAQVVSNSAVSSNWDAIAVTHQKDTASAELTSRANALLAGGNPQAAIEVFKQALFLTPQDEDLYYNLGIAYARSGDTTNAEHYYREALRLLPDYPEVHNNLGNLYLQSGRLAEAEAQLTEAIKLMPELATAQNNLGIVRQRQNRLPDAIACFRKAVQYNTNYWQAHFNLAVACLRQEEQKEAVSELQTVLQLNPGYRPAQQALDQILSQPHQ